jgi:DNA-binding CsgD family transcriptional regulator
MREANRSSPGHDRLLLLTDRERETLGLLFAGHDAKSAARHLGLSVHTINERLRDARRKLAVSTSREAARPVAAASGDPDSIGYKPFGVAGRPDPVSDAGHAVARHGAGQRLAWFSGGMLVMSLVIAAAVISLVGRPVGPGRGPSDTSVAGAATAPDPAAIVAARDWLAQVDAGAWDGEWRTVAALARAQVTQAQWTAAIRAARQPLGPTLSRVAGDSVAATTLPNVPAGSYVVTHWRTTFAAKAGAVETVVLAREQGAWRVAGYFIR